MVHDWSETSVAELSGLITWECSQCHVIVVDWTEPVRSGLLLTSHHGVTKLKEISMDCDVEAMRGVMGS